MRRTLFLATSLVSLLFLATSLVAGCGGKAGEESAGGKVEPPMGDKATASQAYKACRSEIEKLEASGGKLSMITGRMVDVDGLAEAWDFMLLGPASGGDSLLENHVGWEKGEVKTWSYGEQTTMGYENVPQYSYLFHPISGEWLDSPEIARKFASERPPSEASPGGMQMTLRYYADPSQGVEGTVWVVSWEGEQPTAVGMMLLNAGSGEPLKASPKLY